MEQEILRSIIEKTIREEIIFKGLELEELGFTFDDLTLDTALFEENGIGLDSVDALQIVVGMQRAFSITIPDVNKNFLEEHCSTLRKLVELAESKIGEKADSVDF